MNNQATKLHVPVPPMLERAIGYTHSARYVAFYWMPGGDEAMYADGRWSGTGEWTGYLAFVQHPTVAPHLKSYDFGSSDEEATHYLLLDRDLRELFAVDRDQAERFLEKQWPQEEQPVSPITMTKAEMEQAVLKAFNTSSWKEVTAPKPEVIRQHMREQEELVQALSNWLDQQTA
jgi:hypothetical protein